MRSVIARLAGGEVSPGRRRSIVAVADATGTVRVLSADIDYAELAQQLDRMEASAGKEAAAVLDLWKRAAQESVRRYYPEMGADFIARNAVFDRNALTAVLQEMLRVAWAAGGRDARREVGRTFAGTDSSFTPRAALRWLAEKAFWVSGVLSDKLTADVQGEILNGLKTGKSTGEIVIAIATVFLPYLGDPALTDPEQASPHRLETIVRTNTTEAYNHGRLTEYVSPDMAPFLDGVRYSAVMDSRTTEVCRFLDGKVFKPQDPALEQLIPPNHFNCRSIIVPIVVGEKIPKESLITPAEIGQAKELAGAKFLWEGACPHGT